MMAFAEDADIFDKVDHHYVENDGLKIHYVTVGEGPVLFFVHGVPEWWGTWYRQIADLSSDYKCVAMDTRGYNLSDKPNKEDPITVEQVMGDMKAVLKDVGADSITLIGHDYGGFAAWSFAMYNPDLVNKLIMCNMTHFKGYQQVLVHGTPQQRAAMDYIDRVANSGTDNPGNSAGSLDFAAGFESEKIKAKFTEAMSRTPRQVVVNYYRALYPWFKEMESGADLDLPDLKMPVLQFHALADINMDKDGLRDTWNWVEKDYTLVTLPGVSHFVQRESHEIVTQTMRWWLEMRQ